MNAKNDDTKKHDEKPEETVISLDDLSPESDVTGGSGTVLFGQRAKKKVAKKRRPKKS